VPLIPSAFSVIDVETTGLGVRARLIDIAIVDVEGATVGSQWHTPVRMPRRASRVRSAPQMKECEVDAPTFSDLASDIRVRLADRTVFAYNARFDARILQAEFRRLGEEGPSRSFRCALAVARRTLPGLASYSLRSVASAVLGIGEVLHRALPDALLTARILIALAGGGGAIDRRTHGGESHE
jgi:DNA polymerase III epsilon subunit-like protein